MTMKPQLPQQYRPYDELIVCSNTMINGIIPFEIGGCIPLLVGKGEIPHVWLQVLIDPIKQEWAYIVEDNHVVGSPNFRNDPLKLNTFKKKGLVEVAVGKLIILRVEKHSDTKAVISRLELRPLGLNIYGTEDGLHIVRELLRENRFENVPIMVGIAKTWDAVLESDHVFEPISPEEELSSTEKQLANRIQEATELYERNEMGKLQNALSEIQSLIRENINNLTDLSLFQKMINLELSLNDETRNKEVIEVLHLYRNIHGVSRDLLKLAIKVALEINYEKIVFEVYDQLIKEDPTDPFPNLEVGIMFSALGNNKGAIKETEEALKKSLESQSEELIILSKANLAYFYADTGEITLKEKAMEYANLAVQQDPDNPAYKDTLGFVEIIFGESTTEIKHGMKLCTEVRNEGGPLEYYEKHIAIASQRLKAL